MGIFLYLGIRIILLTHNINKVKNIEKCIQYVYANALIVDLATTKQRILYPHLVVTILLEGGCFGMTIV